MILKRLPFGGLFFMEQAPKLISKGEFEDFQLVKSKMGVIYYLVYFTFALKRHNL